MRGGALLTTGEAGGRDLALETDALLLLATSDAAMVASSRRKGVKGIAYAGRA